MDTLAVGLALLNDLGSNFHTGDTGLCTLLIGSKGIDHFLRHMDAGDIVVHKLRHTGRLRNNDTQLNRLAKLLHNAMLHHLYDLMRVGKYDHDLSFVSQIRTFSVVKTVKYLKEAGLEADFNSFKLITITDDADQDDKWRNDYKNLSVADKISRGRKPISQRTKETIQQYVFNDLTSVGAGAFKEVFADDSKMPHIWVYDYVTLQSMSDTQRRKVLRVGGHDGKHMTFVPKHIYHGEDELCFYGVDSVVVNGVSHVISQNFNKRYEASFPYKNGLRFNDVKVYGSVQFKYEDDIYGPHYRKVRFIQEQMIPSGMWAFIFTVLGILAGITVVGFLVYRFIILPRRTIATIYSGNGSKIKLKRGFRFQWKNEVTPVAHYDHDISSIRNVLVRKCSNVLYTPLENTRMGHDLLIYSRVRLNLSENDIVHTSKEDLDADYQFETGKYPKLLKEVYSETMVARIRTMYHSTSDRIIRWCLRFIIGGLDRCFPVYYYYFSDISQYESICFGSPDLLSDRKFIVETDTGSAKISLSIEEKIISKALTMYYNDREGVAYDALLCYDVYGDKEYWSIVLLNDPTALHSSLKDVFVIYRYVRDVDSEKMPENQKLLLSYARRAMRGYSIGVRNCVYDLYDDCQSFNITSVPVPGFISMLEHVEKPRALLLYSPFKDGFIKYKYLSLKPNYTDGHLYLSFLPYKYIKPDPELGPGYKDQMLIQLSNDVIRTSDWTSGKMVFSHNELKYRGINVKF